jgi:HSP20 family protein
MMQRSMSPWKLMDAVLSDLDRVTRTAFNTDIDVLETNDSVLVIANLPGVKPEDVNLSLTQNVLTLEARFDAPQFEGARVLHSERNANAQIKRSIHIPVRLSPDDVQANLEHGVLTVTLKKTPDATPKRITINSANNVIQG